MITSMYQFKFTANLSARIATFKTISSIIAKSFASWIWSNSSLIIYDEVSSVASLNRLSRADLRILISGSFSPERKTPKLFFIRSGQCDKWNGVAYESKSKAVYLMFGSLIPINFASNYIESLISSLFALSPKLSPKRIASNKILWSELFLFICFVTSVPLKTLRIIELIS